MRRRTHHDDNPRSRHDNTRRHSHNSASTPIPPASIWLPILTHHLGIKSKKHEQYFLLSCLAILLSIWFLTPLSDYIATGVLWTVPLDSDVALGRESLLSLERNYPPVVDRWGVKSIGMDLVKSGTIASSSSNSNAQSSSSHHSLSLFDNIHLYQWDFGVIHAPQIVNAFALPGGIVRVTDSLLQILDLTDGELAALIGHEMGHVLNRHSQKRAVKNRLLSTIWEAFTFDDQDDTHDESFGEAVAEGLFKSASFLGEMKFSRGDEYEADEAAWDLLASTYNTGNVYYGSSGGGIRQYHPKNVRRLLKKLWDYQGGTGSTTWESTHPGTKDRIEALEEKWKKLSSFEKRKFVM